MVIKNIKQLGKLVKTTRKAQKLTQVELAAASGVGVRFISDLEAGKETISFSKALAVTSVLGLNLSYENK